MIVNVVSVDSLCNGNPMCANASVMLASISLFGESINDSPPSSDRDSETIGAIVIANNEAINNLLGADAPDTQLVPSPVVRGFHSSVGPTARKPQQG